MKTDDWIRWAGDWQSQPAVDVEWLERRVSRKRRQMQLVVFAEIVITIFAIAQVTRLQLMPGVPLRWKVWGVFALLLAAAIAYASIRIRRGTWRAAGDAIPELLRLTAKRARAGIRLAWMNILGFLVLLAISLPFAAPYLAPSRWRHDPGLQYVLILNVAINGTIVVAFLVFYALYIRRQRNLLRRVEALSRDFLNVDAEPDQAHG